MASMAQFMVRAVGGAAINRCATRGLVKTKQLTRGLEDFAKTNTQETLPKQKRLLIARAPELQAKSAKAGLIETKNSCSLDSLKVSANGEKMALKNKASRWGSGELMLYYLKLNGFCAFSS
jgi:hypothetical protein